jgi:hypothetical protein
MRPAAVLQRTQREKKTVEAMIRMFCASRHGMRVEDCESCRQLLAYARRKIDTCRFHEFKPASNECRIHCYSRQSREQIRAVMRFSGPRMMIFHPILGSLHMVDRLLRRGVGAQ